jgi:hypothetical protein
MDRLLSYRRQWFLESKGLLSLEQAGSRKCYSTTDHISKLALDIKLGYGDQQSTVVIFLDILKTYNSSFWSQALLYKAVNLGITGLILSWIKDFIKGRTMCIRVGDKLSQQPGRIMAST